MVIQVSVLTKIISIFLFLTLSSSRISYSYQIFPFEASRKYPEHNIYKFDLECTSKEMYKNALQSLSTLSKCVRSSPSSQTPHTPKETTPSASKAFFQTPGTLGSAVSAVPATRKRGSAQRRLDVGHPPTS